MKSSFVSDFKAFALKGNVVDMAVGVIIGGAFGKIVSSLVADIVTPLISMLTGAVTLNELKWVLKEAVTDVSGEITQAEVAVMYGNFLQTVIDFLIIALSIFIVMRVIMKAHSKLDEMKKKEEETAAEEAAAVAETELSVLKDIKELLGKKQGAE